MVTRSQNQGMLGHPGAIRMILFHGESCNFSTTLPKMAAGGKAYASRSSHGRLSASTAVARESGNRNTNKGNLVLNLVANRSIWGRWHLLHIAWKTPEGETTLSGWPGLAWIACLLPPSAGLECVRLWELLNFWCTRSRFSIVEHKWAQPHASFLVYVCCRYKYYIVYALERSSNSFKDRKTALNSR